MRRSRRAGVDPGKPELLAGAAGRRRHARRAVLLLDQCARCDRPGYLFHISDALEAQDAAAALAQLAQLRQQSVT